VIRVHAVRVAWVAACLAGAVVGCASGPDPTAAPLADPRDPGRPQPPLAKAQVWFAARVVPCDRVVDALAHFAGQPGVSAPETVRPRESAPWCALAGNEKHGVRADSWAQNVSSMLKVPSIAFYVADGSWSYAVFDAGEPICAMESHFGSPVVVGDLARCAGAIGVTTDRLASYRLRAREVPAHRELAVRLGFDYPQPDEPTVAVRPIPSPDAPPPAVVAPKQTKPFEAGQWVVMPPLGVMLVKAVEGRPGPDGGAPAPTYVVVAGERVLTVPTATAPTLGMRALATKEEAERLLTHLADEADVADSRRYDEARTRRWLEALKGGDLAAIADAHRELCAIQGDRTLYSIEAGMLDTVRGWLVDELSTAKGVQAQEIDAALREACD
jgi:RNA polymerase-interacting CarD/CdnL/TRCF family regulator